MTVEYKIHPPIGVARIGNSDEFYLSPEKIGGRPIECEQKHGNIKCKNNKVKYVTKFKDGDKKVKKQAAKFQILKHDSTKAAPEEVDLTDKSKIKSVKWTVHLANKKSAWYHFSEFKGDVMLGSDNTYEKKKVPLRNSEFDGKRRHLIIDYGPRYLTDKKQRVHFRKDENVPYNYPVTSPKYDNEDRWPTYGHRVDYLGTAITDSKCNLLVLGGHGNCGGDESFDSFAGGEKWYDDMSDGPVICEIELANGDKHVLDAWVIVGPPKFAPELVNISTLDDVMLDVAVQYFGAAPEIYDKKKWPQTEGWNPDYDKVNFERDIEPIIKRMAGYRWVANVPSMMDFCMPSFDLKDNSKENYQNRKRYYDYFRMADTKYWGIGGDSDILFSTVKGVKNDYIHGIPLMPLNAGSNAVSDMVPDKFVELSRTQHYFLKQWSEGKFTTGKADDILGMMGVDHADVGNCVGNPMCPGVEVTWSVKNPTIYSGPYRIKHRNINYKTGKIDSDFYFKKGLDPDWDETALPTKTGPGCEPGDLTKRMADPWVSDLFECNVNNINFTDQSKVMDKSDEIAAPPTYYAYWWPPQSPWDVIMGITDTGETSKARKEQNTIDELAEAGASAGQQVNYIRGINNHIEMVYAWSYLGFIVNQNEGVDRDQYPYFVEKERNHEEFQVSAVVAANKIHYLTNYNINLLLSWYLKKDIIQFTDDAKKKKL